MRAHQEPYVRLARITRRVRSAHSVHAPAALIKLGLFVALTLALAVAITSTHKAQAALGLTPGNAAQSAVTTIPGAVVRPPVRIVVSRVHLNALQDRSVRIHGLLVPGLAGQKVSLEERHGGRWHRVAHAFTGRRGHFSLRYVPREPSTLALRVLADGKHRSLGLLNIYRAVEASWYGGGGSLACGGQLTSSTLGVANKTLPCGTLVTLRYGGHTVRVPVIDRGPFVPGREFDLTEATKEALGFPGLGTVWSNR